MLQPDELTEQGQYPRCPGPARRPAGCPCTRRIAAAPGRKAGHLAALLAQLASCDQLHHAPFRGIAAHARCGRQRQRQSAAPRKWVVTPRRQRPGRALMQRRIPEQARHRRALRARRGPSPACAAAGFRLVARSIKGGREAQVRLRAALVETHRDDRGDALERRVGSAGSAREHPLGRSPRARVSAADASCPSRVRYADGRDRPARARWSRAVRLATARAAGAARRSSISEPPAARQRQSSRQQDGQWRDGALAGSGRGAAAPRRPRSRRARSVASACIDRQPRPHLTQMRLIGRLIQNR